MDPHRFDRDGDSYEVLFERTPESWVARIYREGTNRVQVVGFPEGAGFDPADVRGSLIAGCEAIVAHQPEPAPTRH